MGALAAPPLLRDAPLPAVSPTAVAVLPFVVRGGAEHAYLREGMVDLLSATLDGAGDLRAVHPRAVLGAIPADSAAVLDPQRGHQAAARLGAGAYVLGDVIPAAGRLHVTASLYEPRSGSAPTARASATGDTSELFSLVDQLTAQLVAARSATPGGRVVRVAAATTASLPALKAYLAGETHFRALRLPEAIDALQQAVTLDSTFALAWYRLGVAASWRSQTGLAHRAMSQAVRYGAELSEHDRRIVEAYLAGMRGRPEEGERLLRAVLADHPADVEAWNQMGEVWFHENWHLGRSFTESRQAWERVLALDPRNVGATAHLAQVAAHEGRHAELDTLFARLLGAMTGPPALSWRALRALTRDGPAQQAALLPELRTADDYTLVTTVWRSGVYSEDLAGIDRYALLLTDRRRLPEVRAFGYLVRAHLAVAGGQRKRAHEELAAVSALNPAWALEYRALFALHPLAPATPDELAAAREALRGWKATATPPVVSPASIWINAHAATHPQLRDYLLGMLGARLGDVADAERYAASLAAHVPPAGSDTAHDAERLARVQARSIRFEVARSQAGSGGRVALEQGVQPARITFEPAWASPFFSQAHERFGRGELLLAHGRHDEALAWFDTFADIFPYEIAYLAPAHLRRAEIHEARGRPEQAAAHYRRFVALWRACDPELRPLVAEAERRLARLERAGG